MSNTEVKYTQLFINNEFVNAESGKKFPTYNPATEQVIAQVHEAGSADVDKAVAAARKAFEIGSEWRSMDPSARGQLLMKFGELLRRDIDYLSVKYIIISFKYLINRYSHVPTKLPWNNQVLPGYKVRTIQNSSDTVNNS